MAPTATRTTRRSSDLSKHSAEVFAEAEDHPVTVTRRDGEDLVLMTQREADSRARLLEFAAQLIRWPSTTTDPSTDGCRAHSPGCWHFPRRIVPSALETWSTPHARRSRPTNRTWYLRN